MKLNFLLKKKSLIVFIYLILKVTKKKVKIIIGLKFIRV
jgi:hypothetical protein